MEKPPLEFAAGVVDAALSELAGDAEGIVGLLAAAQVAETRMLARAGQIAAAEAVGQRAGVRAHDMALRSIAAELAGVFRVTDRTMQGRIGDAQEIVEKYPVALSAWESGFITRGHVNVIVDAGRIVGDERRAEYEREAIDRCLRDTPNRVRAGLELYAEKLTERSFTERHEEAARRRAVRLIPGRDGMCDVIATVPAVIGDGILDRLTRMAHVVIDAGDRRGIDEVRADVFADLLLAGAPQLDPTAHGDADGVGALGAIRAHVQVVVPASALVGLGDDPADLVGRSPVDADTARRLAGSAPSLSRILTDPVTGGVLVTDRYRPTTDQRRHLRVRDQHCRFPGCRLAAIRCEIDHTIDHVLGGPTTVGNLAHLCQRHHSMKQFTRWRVRQRGGGVLEWTSPTGRIYREDAPTAPVAFAGSDEPAPRASSTIEIPRSGLPDAPDPPDALDPPSALDPPGETRHFDKVDVFGVPDEHPEIPVEMLAELFDFGDVPSDQLLAELLEIERALLDPAPF